MSTHQKTIMLTLGGARSGKTAYAEAEALALARAGKKLFFSLQVRLMMRERALIAIVNYAQTGLPQWKSHLT